MRFQNNQVVLGELRYAVEVRMLGSSGKVGITINNNSFFLQEAIRPYKFVFPPEKYNDYPKISTRCNPLKAVEVINNLSHVEKRWFRTHPQFKHIFHMELHKSRMCMGIWMLGVRTVVTGDRTQCWFVVNGVPIRYSLREHTLISGLYCHNYPQRLEEIGSMQFVRRHFGQKKPDVQQVLDKLNSMEEANTGRLKMAILLFLATVIKGKQKEIKGSIDDFLLRVVDDIDMCSSFPWGRYTYDDCIHNVYKMVDKFDKCFATNHCLPGFILPLEILAFECIETLRVQFREDVEPVDDDCPRMCRRKFKKSALKGFSLQELYETLGGSKAIESTIVPDGEVDAHIAPEELKVSNPLVDGWNDILTRHGRIWWEDLYNLDLASRGTTENTEEPSTQAPMPPCVEQSDQPSREQQPVHQEAVQAIMKAMEDNFQKLEAKMEDNFQKLETKVDKKIEEFSERLREVEERGRGAGDVGCDEEEVGAGDVGGDEGGAGDAAGEGEIASEVAGESASEAGFVSNHDPNQFALVLYKPQPRATESSHEVSAESKGERRRRMPSRYCKTPYTRRTRRKKT